MNLCSNDHPTICHDSWDCPLCMMREDLHEDLASLRAALDELDSQFKELDDEFYQIEQQNSRFRSLLSDIAPEHLL